MLGFAPAQSGGTSMPSIFPRVEGVSDVSRVDTVRMRFEAPAMDLTDVRARLANAVGAGLKVTAFGKRHSQGHHVLLADALALDLEALQSVQVTQLNGTPCVKVGCGALWDDVHAALIAHHLKGNHAFAPRTQQSSPYFSVGGSLAVNCHGRDPSQPPLAGTVLKLHVMRADGRDEEMDAASHPLEFAMLLGGFGGGALLLAAWIALKPEQMLQHRVTVQDLGGYLTGLRRRMNRIDPWPAMHYAWLCFSNDATMFSEAIAVDSTEVPGQPVSGKLRHESFLSDDGMALLYKEFRKGPATAPFWQLLKAAAAAALGGGKVERTLNAMRAPVRFSDYMGLTNTDLLQEYFLPDAEVEGFLDAARQVLLQHHVKLLTSTLRVVQADTSPLLNYAPQPRVSIVLNMNVPLADCRSSGGGPSVLETWTRKLVQAALARGGSFYLPYHRGATVNQLKAAYPNWQQYRAQRRLMDPGLVFDNGFLQHYGL